MRLIFLTMLMVCMCAQAWAQAVPNDSPRPGDQNTSTAPAEGFTPASEAAPTSNHVFYYSFGNPRPSKSYNNYQACVRAIEAAGNKGVCVIK